ncbi:MAG: PadR family transcriptional regulator [Bacteroidaceae bacterium]|jgi:PadR family transcriptional regulator PadR|nr:PadR family transcriptional regulator [Bacteroidaceae bacterium]MBQ5839352.1 PadR family transcriptional regulator [Bacteroidaceae bacterium]
MNIENTKAQMRKGMLEYCIMLILKQRSCYANDIIRELKEADMIVVEGTLYPLLNRLLKERILKYEWQESTQGPPRKYYSLTLDGEEVLRQLNSSWLEISNTVNKLHEQ